MKDEHLAKTAILGMVGDNRSRGRGVPAKKMVYWLLDREK